MGCRQSVVAVRQILTHTKSQPVLQRVHGIPEVEVVVVYAHAHEILRPCLVATHVFAAGVSQAELEAIVTNLVHQILAEGPVGAGARIMGYLQLNGVPRAYRAFLVTEVWLEVGTAYPLP